MNDVAANVLPKVCELECGAGVIGEELSFFITVATHVEDEAADRVCGARTVIEKLIPCIVASDALILFEGVDEIKKGLFGDVEFFDGGCECDVDGMLGRTGVAAIELIFPPIEKLEGMLGVAYLIAKVV